MQFRILTIFDRLYFTKTDICDSLTIEGVSLGLVLLPTYQSGVSIRFGRQIIERQTFLSVVANWDIIFRN
jgi:hypothetical protein